MWVEVTVDTAVGSISYLCVGCEIACVTVMSIDVIACGAYYAVICYSYFNFYLIEVEWSVAAGAGGHGWVETVF